MVGTETIHPKVGFGTPLTCLYSPEQQPIFSGFYLLSSYDYTFRTTTSGFVNFSPGNVSVPVLSWVGVSRKVMVTDLVDVVLVIGVRRDWNPLKGGFGNKVNFQELEGLGLNVVGNELEVESEFLRSTSDPAPDCRNEPLLRESRVTLNPRKERDVPKRSEGTRVVWHPSGIRSESTVQRR